MSKSVALIPNIKFPLGKSSRMLDAKDTWARMFTAAPFSKPKGGNHRSGYSLPADKWTNRCGPSTSWDVILPQGRERRSHRLQCGRALETRDQRAQAKGRVEAVRAGWGQVAASGPRFLLGAGGGVALFGTRWRWWGHIVPKAAVWLTLKRWTVYLPNVASTKTEGSNSQRPWVRKLTKNYENSRGRGSTARRGLWTPELDALVQVQTLPGYRKRLGRCLGDQMDHVGPPASGSAASVN